MGGSTRGNSGLWDLTKLSSRWRWRSRHWTRIMFDELVPRIKFVISLPICRVIKSLVEVEDLHFHENFQSAIIRHTDSTQTGDFESKPPQSIDRKVISNECRRLGSHVCSSKNIDHFQDTSHPTKCHRNRPFLHTIMVIAFGEGLCRETR